MKLTSHVIDLDGPVHYIDSGESSGDSREETPLVLVHGLGGSHANWLAVAPTLAKKRRVIALDVVGFGKSPLHGRRSRVTDNRRILSRFLDHVVGRPVVLVGNSMGGMLTMMHATTRPAALEGIVLVNPTLPKPKGTPLDREVTLAFAVYMIPFFGGHALRRRNAKMTPEQSVAEVMKLCCVDPSRIPREAIDAMVEVARHRRSYPWAEDAFIDAARSIVRKALQYERFVDLLSSLRVPTLLLHGTHDRLVPVESARAAARLRPDWTTVIFDDVGHVPQLEVPDAFVDAVEGWLEARRAKAATAREARP